MTIPESVATTAVHDDLGDRVRLFLHQTGRNWVEEVKAVDGAAAIYGVAPSFYERQLAVSAAKRVAGVRKVIDRIVVASGGLKSTAGVPQRPK